MTKAYEFIESIDAAPGISFIKYRGYRVWLFLRQIYFFQYHRSYFGFVAKKQIGIFSNIWRIKNIFYGVGNWFHRYDYVFMTLTGSRRLLGEKYINKDAEWLLRELGKEKSLLVEFSDTGRHLKRTVLSGENIVSGDLFNLVGMLPSIRRKLFMDNEQILKGINKEYDLCVNYRWAIFAFFRLVWVFTLFYKIWRPKVMFVTCYYSLVNQASIFAAKKAGVKVVELQHGLIVDRHPSYNIACELDHSFFPDYLLCYGESVRDVFGEGNSFVDSEHVLPVGNGYLEYIAHQLQEPRELTTAMAGYEKVVSVTSQCLIETKLIEFLKDAARLNDKILYIFIPRDLGKDYSSMGFPENIILIKSLDFYRITAFVDFHSTVNSSCALESPAFGVPNLLIDIDELATYAYGSILKDRSVSRFVSTPAEYVEMILGWNSKQREDIINAHKAFVRPSHRSNLREALGCIIGKT